MTGTRESFSQFFWHVSGKTATTIKIAALIAYTVLAVLLNTSAR